jgi:hypothetical protein
VGASPSLLLKLAVAGALSLAVVELVPRSADSSGSQPPVRTLLVTAVLIGLFCVAALLWGMVVDLRLPAKVAVYAVAFNLLVILVKFLLAPRGFYEVNQTKDLDSTFAIDTELMAFLAALLIFVLYFAAYVVLYRIFARRIEHLRERDPLEGIGTGRQLIVLVVLLALLLSGAGGALVLILIPVVAGVSYLDFVFSSGLSLLVALALAGATGLAALAFDASSDRARVVGDASLYMSFFWFGLYFLALYHVLWVVYVLVLTSIWPLKVVTPK